MKKLLTAFILLLSITAIAEASTQQRLSKLEKRVKKIEKAISYRLEITGHVTENVTAELMELVEKQKAISSFHNEQIIDLEIDDHVTQEHQKIYFKILNACFGEDTLEENQAFQIDTIWLRKPTKYDDDSLAYFLDSDKMLGLRLYVPEDKKDDKDYIKNLDLQPYIDACVTKVTLRKRDIKKRY